jgi:hypothetical protein
VPRPSFQPTEEQRKRVKSLSALGMRHKDICLVIGLRSPKSLRKHFREELSTGMAEANAVVARMAYEMAVSGRCPAMTFFYLKCRTKRAERVEEEEPNKDWSVELRFPDKEGLPGYEPRVIRG